MRTRVLDVESKRSLRQRMPAQIDTSHFAANRAAPVSANHEAGLQPCTAGAANFSAGVRDFNGDGLVIETNEPAARRDLSFECVDEVAVFDVVAEGIQSDFC